MSRQIVVLHLDDEPDFAELVATRLEREDDRLDVRTTSTPDDGLEVLTEQDVDCVVCDQEMPGQNGIEFLETVRESHPDLPFILFTGQGSEAVASEAISAGVTDYLQKRPGQEQYELLANRVVDAVEHRRAETSYREIFEKTPDGIVVHDPADGSFTDMNEKYAEMYDYDRAELLAADFETILPDEPPYTTAEAREEIRQAIEDGSRTIEWPGVRRDGSWVWTEVHLSTVRLHGEDRVLATVREITERKEREQRLEAQNERLEELASVVSHDLRNPLAVARGRLDLARAECDSDHLNAIDDSLERMRELTDDVLTIALGDTAAIEPTTIDLEALIANCWQTVPTAEATLEVDVDATVQGDERHLRRVFENLFRNAVEHGSTNPHSPSEDAAQRGGEDLTVSVGELEDGFYVADDGRGIPPAEREDVFETGYSTGEFGHGYGLRIVQQAVEAHGWEIRATENPAGGARFEITGVESLQ